MMTIKLFSILAALFAGSMIAFQAPINAKLGSVMGGPLVGTFCSFAVGTLILGVLMVAGGHVPRFEQVAQTQIWWWIGGALGAILVYISIAVVPILGAALMIALFVTGQLIGALIIDKTGFLLPMQIDIGWERIAALVLILGGVVLFTRSQG